MAIGDETHSTGTTPMITDSRRVLLVKKLRALQNASASPSPLNNPRMTDSRRRLQVKIDRVRAGLTSGG